MTDRIAPSMKRDCQGGAALVMGLVFLLVLTVIGLSTMSNNLLQEHMSGNTRDSNTALQAAEAALRDGEADVQANITPESAFDATCSAGLCAARADSILWWQANPTWRNYGSATGSSALLGVAQQPRYIIEEPVALASASATIGSKPQATGWAYRITAQGFGARTNTQVVLQSIYIVR